MEKLYGRASQLEDLLDEAHSSPQLLLETLETAVQNQPFFVYVDRLGAHNCPHAYYQNCRIAIQKHMQHSRVSTTRALPQVLHSFSTSTANTGSQTSNAKAFTRSMFAKAGRRYAYDNNTSGNRRTNPLGPDGKPRQCRNCGSIYHYLRNCDKLKKPVLVNLMIDGDAPSQAPSYDLSVNEMFDEAQNLPDDVWTYFASKNISLAENLNAPTDSSQISNVLYSRLCTLADIHEMFPSNWLSTACLASPYDSPPLVLTTSSQQLSDLSLPDRIKFITDQVAILMKTHKTTFEGVMIDNGAALSPAGLPAYLRYCAHTGIAPSLKQSNRCFRGIGKGLERSLGKISIRLPLGPDCLLEFEVDLVENDVPIIFGLEHHREFQCSSNEVENTFTHHPPGTIAPVTFRHSNPLDPAQGGHVFLTWSISTVLYTESELEKLHCSFGPPSSDNLQRLLQKSQPNIRLDATVKSILDDISKRCSTCQNGLPNQHASEYLCLPTNFVSTTKSKLTLCGSTVSQYSTLSTEEQDTLSQNF